MAEGEPKGKYYIHPADQPGMLLVSKPLTGENYISWSRAMKIALNAKDMLGFVDGTEKMPSQDKDPIKYKQWSRCNDLVLSWIQNALSPQVVDSSNSDYAYEVWEELKERFSQGNRPRLFELRREISTLEQGQSTVTEYYTRLKILWDELSVYKIHPVCSCGGCTFEAAKTLSSMEQNEKVIQFLLGLNDTFSSVRGNILLISPLPSLSKVYSLILQEERQRRITASGRQSEVMAMVVEKGDENSKSNFKKNYRDSKFGQNKNQKKNKAICSHCDGIGHTADGCFWIIGFPPGHRLHKVHPGPNKNATKNVNHASTSNMVIQEGRDGIGLTQDQYERLVNMLENSKEGSFNNMSDVQNTRTGQEEFDWTC